MATERCNMLSTKFGLDSQIAVDLYKSFVDHINIPKEKWNKYHEPFKDVCNFFVSLPLRKKNLN